MSQHGDQYSRQCDICLKFAKNEKAFIDHKIRNHQEGSLSKRYCRFCFHMLEAYENKIYCTK